MIVCSNCSQSNMAGAVYCSECGAALVAADSPSPQDIKASPPIGSVGHKPATVLPAGTMTDNWVTLHLLDTGQVLPLAERNEFTLGRSSEGQPITPDVDLSPYQAHAGGVSRLHAVIKRGVDQVYLMDLDSANGTYLNGKRLVANEEQPLANGDVVALGKLKIQILLKPA